jgi:hypothetical protein
MKRTKSIFEHVIDTIRALGAPEQERRKVYQDYRTLSDEEIEERLERVNGISYEALRAQAGQKTADYYLELRRLYRDK